MRDLPKYATLVVDKIAKSVAMLIYDILPVHLWGVARVHLGESATKDFFWEFSGIFSRDDLALGPTPRNPYTTTVVRLTASLVLHYVMPGRREAITRGDNERR